MAVVRESCASVLIPLLLLRTLAVIPIASCFVAPKCSGGVGGGAALMGRRRIGAHALTVLTARYDDESETNGDDGDDSFDVEKARNRLEETLGGFFETNDEESDDDEDDYDDYDDEDDDDEEDDDTFSSDSPPRGRLDPSLLDRHAPPLLTPAERESKIFEAKLLETLLITDDATTGLWSHWFSERGAKAANELLQAEELANLDESIDMDDDAVRLAHAEAERRFRDLIAEHGPYWAEPVNRLATLLYKQGRLDESKACCELVLQVKPWHFGALSGMVLVCVGRGDYVNARIWADRRLPPLQERDAEGVGLNGAGGNAEGLSRRHQWVFRAMRDATTSLQRQAQKTVSSSSSSSLSSFTLNKEQLQQEEDAMEGIVPDDMENNFQ